MSCAAASPSSEEICSYAASLATQPMFGIRSAVFGSRGRTTFSSGGRRKIDGFFRAMIDDCNAERSEAMHHLKTMAECLICFWNAGNSHLGSKVSWHRATARVTRQTGHECYSKPPQERLAHERCPGGARDTPWSFNATAGSVDSRWGLP
jgi:hypothetical protein